MSILRTIAMFIYLFGYMILHYGILRRAERAAAAGRDHRNAGRLHDRLCQLQVKAGLGAVPIHRGEQDLARAERGYLARPCDRVDAGRRSLSQCICFPFRLKDTALLCQDC